MTAILILGATGFIGGHIARLALSEGWQVRGLRRGPGAAGALTGAGIDWFEGDLDRAQGPASAFEGVDIVFHAAGFYPTGGERSPGATARGVAQTRHVLEACRRARVPRLVYTSTLTTIGAPGPGEGRLADERDHYLPGSLPGSAYYESKYAMESEVLRSASAWTVVLNPTAVLGPGDVHLSLARVVLAAARGQMRFWLPVTTNVVDVRDVAADHLRAASLGRPGERTILGGHNVTVRELLERVARLTGRRPPRWELSPRALEAAARLASLVPGLAGGTGHLRAVRRWQGYDTSKARRELGSTARPLEETLRDTLEWLEASGYRWRP
ncbi:MAG: NAD-dependent epimerase/dehydratase family protein [Anaerolineales bacterium]